MTCSSVQKKASICGTDVHIYNWDAWAQKTIPVPMPIGHEFVGEIAESARRPWVCAKVTSSSAKVTSLAGIAAIAWPVVAIFVPNTQGIGVNRPGAWAEFVSIPATNAGMRIPPSRSMFFPVSIRSVTPSTPRSRSISSAKMCSSPARARLAAWRCPICKHAGARHVVITDVNPYRLELARKMGATLALDVRTEKLSDAMKQLGMKEGFDVASRCRAIPKRLPTFCRTCFTAAKSRSSASCPPARRSTGTSSSFTV